MRRGGLAKKIRWFAAGTGLILALLLAGRAVGLAAAGLDEESCRRAVEEGGRLLVDYVWRQANPGAEKSGGRRGTGNAPADPDPAYRQYEAVKTFYQEHQYLAWYGNEETGETSGPGDGGGAGNSGAAGPAGAGENGGAGGGAADSPGGTGGRDGTGAAGAAGAAGTALSASAGAGSGAGPDSGSAAAAGQADFSTQIPAGAVLVGKIARPITGPTYVLEQLADYDFLMKHFYIVHTSTTAGRDEINAKQLYGEDLSIEKDASKPQILIYHTHSQEAFADSGPGQTVVGIGNYLTELLTAKGYNVIHDTSVYDLIDGKLDRSKAYTYAYDGVKKILEENPSIEVVLDIHRDGVGKDLHLVTDVDGRPTAQIMFFNGMSQTPEGPIEYLKNPYRAQNLAFSFQMQLDAQAYYPGFTRKIYLKGLRYNLHLRPRSALIEVGAQTNTYEEAKNAMLPLSELLDMVLQQRQKNDIIQ